MRARDRGEWRRVETIGGDSSKTRLVMKKRKKLTPGISTSLTPDYREKEENNMFGNSFHIQHRDTQPISNYLVTR